MIIFIYDDLMLQDIQDNAKIEMEQLGFAYIKGKLYFYNDYIKRRTFLVPNNKTISNVFGVVYDVDNVFLHKLFGYYSSSFMYTKTVLDSDTYVMESCDVQMIKFDTIEQFRKLKFEKLDKKLQINAFIGNLNNDKIKNSIKFPRWYQMDNFDDSFKVVLGNNAK